MKWRKSGCSALLAVLLASAFLSAGGCSGGGGNGEGGGDMGGPAVVNTLCGSIEQAQDDDFIDCGVSVSVINDLGTTQARQGALTGSYTVAKINLPLLEEAENRNFVNVAIDFNGDGTVADYAAGEGVQREWVVQNSPVIIFPFDYNFHFEVADSSIGTGTPYSVTVLMSDDTIESAEGLNDPSSVEGSSFVTGEILLSVFDFDNRVDPDPEAFGSGGLGSAGGSIAGGSGTAAARERQVMTVNGVDILIVEGVPDLPQTFNICVPSSIANSIAWLAKEFDFDLMIDDGGGTKFPVDVNDIESINNDLLNPLISEYDSNNGFVKQNGQIKGVLPQNIVPIKEGFLQKNNVPIKTTEIDIDPENPGDLVEQIKDRLEDRCMVEAKLQLFNADGQKIGSHMVNVTGYSLGQSFDDFDGFEDPRPVGDPAALRKLVFHDANHTVFDRDTGLPAPQNDIYDFNFSGSDVRIENYMYGPPGTATARLVGAIVQCVDVESDETTFDLTVMTDGELSIIHKVFQSPCPQPIGTITITNTGDVPFDWFRMGILGTRTTPPGGSLEPGESVTLTVEFTCDPPKDVMGNIIIKAMVGQNEKEFSFPVSVDVQN